MPRARIFPVLMAALLGASAVSAQTWRNTNPISARTAFGAALAIEGNELFVGRPGEIGFFPAPSDHAGTVHVYTPDASGNWAERGAVSSPSVTTEDQFGAALAVSGNRLVVGAPHQNGGRGAVYVFERAAAGGNWRETARLVDPGGRENDAFGAAVAIDGDVILVGAPGRSSSKGAVYAYAPGAAGWSAAGTLQGSGTGGNDRFGSSIALGSGRALIGAPGPTPGLFGGGEPKTGAAFVFASQNAQWREQGRLTRSSQAPLAIGSSVAWSGDEAIVGAPLVGNAAGTVLRFRRTDNGWAEAGELTAAPPQPGSGFGSSIAATATDLVVGMPLLHGVGGAVVFRRNAVGNWGQVQVIDGEDQFGFAGGAVAAGNDLIVVGVPGAAFFLGDARAYRRDAATGQWNRVATVTATEPKLEAITGGARNCQDGKVGPFPCAGVDAIAFLPLDALGAERGTVVNDIWGWTDPETGREYALVGRTNGTSFVDVTDGANPRYLGNLPLHEGATINIWRDIKVYRNHAFIVADGAGEHGVQVFDLTRLRNVQNPPATFSETAHYAGIASAHNIVINEESGFGYVTGANSGGETCGGGLHMIDLHEPANPRFVGCFADARTGNARTGYSHDAQCVTYKGPQEKYRGHEICLGSNETALSIADVTDKANPVPISTATYPNVAYQHQGWISDDHRFYFTDDEGDEVAGTVPRTRTLVWDIQDLEDPVLIKEYLGETAASDHNLYVKGNYVYESNYVSGLRILDISDPKNPVEVGFFDTVPTGANSPGFAGSWSNYPFFRSGNIIVTSMREGLFILKQRMRPVS